MSSSALLYRLFKRTEGEAPSVKPAVITLVALAIAVAGFGVVRVAREHEVLSVGYQLTQASEHVRELREAHRRLELELATLTAPERIRKLAIELGMTTVAPDHIQTLDRHSKVAATP